MLQLETSHQHLKTLYQIPVLSVLLYVHPTLLKWPCFHFDRMWKIQEKETCMEAV